MQKRNAAQLIGFSLIFLLPLILSARNKLTKIKAEDFYNLKEITELAISPDGSMLAYVVKAVDQAKNCYTSTIWIMSTQNEEKYQLTATGTGRNWSPTWSPDSRFLGFISTRSGSSQLWKIPVKVGEAQQLTFNHAGAFQPNWSPDGKNILFISKVCIKPHIERLKLKDGRLLDYDGSEYASDVKVITHTRYRERMQYVENEYFQIFVIPVDSIPLGGPTLAGGKPIQITKGAFNNFAPIWSPNSKQIAFLSNRSRINDVEDPFDNNLDICIVRLDKNITRIITSNPGTEQSPVWSPSGNRLAYIANTRLNDYTEQRELWTLASTGGTPILLTKQLDRTVLAPQWASNAKCIYFLVKDRGNQHLYRISISKPKSRSICLESRQITKFCLTPANEKIYFIATDNLQPSNLFVVDSDGKNERQLTYINQAWLTTKQLIQPQSFWYNSFDGLKIQGWIMKPVDFEQAQKFPLIVEIHGGPYWNYGNQWNLEFQLLTTRGYGVFYCNPRISTSYGQVFAKKDQGKWGEGDFKDIMTGLNTVIKQGWVDSMRLGITGGSYGGYLTSWAISQTNRFKAAIAQRGISNIFSFYGTTDIQNFIEFEFGFPWNCYQELWKRSPILYVEKMKTPLLILHSELDYRVPISQAEELYIQLKRCKAEVEFVRYPNEGHELSRSGQPIHRVDRLNRIVGWFERFIQ